MTERERIGSIIRTIKFRCYNPKSDQYKNYGARGIKVCDEWLNGTEGFYNWAKANGYRRGLQIDRIDVNGNYEPSNCRWVEPKVNARNRRVALVFDGKTLPEWCELKNANYKFVHYLIQKGIDWRKALEQKSLGKSVDRVVLRYNKMSLKDVCKQRGLKYGTVYYRIKAGWPIEEALNKPLKGTYGPK